MTMIAEFDDHATELTSKRESNQDGVYVATIRALRKADEEGVTDLTISSDTETVAKHINGDWARRQSNLHALQREVEDMIARFDTVQWI